MDELVHLNLEGGKAELLIKVDESYAADVTYEQGPVIYMELDKALYGTIQAALLFWKWLSTFFKEHSFVMNSYDSCVMYKVIQGKQYTVGGM